MRFRCDHCGELSPFTQQSLIFIEGAQVPRVRCPLCRNLTIFGGGQIVGDDGRAGVFVGETPAPLPVQPSPEQQARGVAKRLWIAACVTMGVLVGGAAAAIAGVSMFSEDRPLRDDDLRDDTAADEMRDVYRFPAAEALNGVVDGRVKMLAIHALARDIHAYPSLGLSEGAVARAIEDAGRQKGMVISVLRAAAVCVGAFLLVAFVFSHVFRVGVWLATGRYGAPSPAAPTTTR